MMGSRGHYSGDERDAFSRRSRRLIRWPPYGAKRIKQAWWRRARTKLRIITRQEAQAGE